MSSNSGSLSAFLILNRASYLDALRENRGHDWTVVVGNEAGDLDSSASSIAYSYLTSTLHNRPTIALLQTPRTDLHLRAENLYAYEISHMLPTQGDLLCIDDIPSELLPRISTSTFALVDHNRLTHRFSTFPFTTPPTVVAVIDHHEDEGSHLEADPRIVVAPVGSCSSLLAGHFANSWKTAKHIPPRELATLLLSAIFIDTNGLKPGGKAVQIDHDAATFLFPMSTLRSPSSELTSSSYIDDDDVALVIDTLGERKEFVSHLTVRDLLRRDYKEYTFQSSSGITKAGLATVPQKPGKWFHEETLTNTWAAIDAWMDERSLNALGVLYTYSRKGKHERQELWVVKSGCDDIKKKLFEGLEASEELRLERKHVEKGLSKHDKLARKGVENGLIEDFVTPAGNMARIWLQGNAKATRKVVAPRVKELLESL